MTAAISFDGLRPEDDTPVGINVATREFLRAHFRFGNQDKFYCVPPNDPAANLYRDYAAEENVSPERCVSINQNDASALEQAGCLVRYDPGIVKFSWARRHHGENRYSLCGIAHASASDSVMDMVGQYLTAPLHSWDAVICPSKAIQSAVNAILSGWGEYIGEKFGVAASSQLELPIIPLGVDTTRFSKIMTDDVRSTVRGQLGIQDDEIVLLYVGRLNHVAKSNPISLLLAAEQASLQCDQKIRILFNGYFYNDVNQEAFEQGVSALCENVAVTFVRHGDPDFPHGAWAAGDIFCSLPDNIQESFGLTPVEAMAAGLPVIASDWDGYKETVRDGVDGLLVPTYMPPEGTGEEIAYRYFAGQFTYGDYLGATSQATSIDLPHLIKSIVSLAADPELRRKMGDAGRQRAFEKFEWSRVINAYEELWNELSLRRTNQDDATAPAPGASFHPSRPDPFSMFSSFPTASFNMDGQVTLSLKDWPEILRRVQLKLGLVQPDVLIDLEELPGLIAELEARESVTLQILADAMNVTDLPRFVMTIGWLVKLGICSYAPPDRKPDPGS